MPDYMFLLESRLSPEQRAVMLRVQELSAALGFNVYLTGGTVRDLVTGASLRDLDFTVEANPSKIAHELEKGGAKILHEDEKYRHVEVLFAGDCEGSISAARDDHYVRPGTRPEIRWSTIMEDLRRRDFSLNAIAISLNPASRGLLLDPTNGLSDIERAEVRALTIHSFTNQPVRLLRVLRYAARMGFKIEQRTQEWFDLAIERKLQDTIAPEDAGDELRALAREERPAVVLKAWEEHDLLEAVNPVLAKKHPSYDAIGRLMRVREDLFTAGFRPRLAAPMLLAILGKLKDRELANVLSKAGFRAAEVEAARSFEDEALEAQKELLGRRMNAPVDAFRFLEKMPLDQVAYYRSSPCSSLAAARPRKNTKKSCASSPASRNSRKRKKRKKRPQRAPTKPTLPQPWAMPLIRNMRQQKPRPNRLPRASLSTQNPTQSTLRMRIMVRAQPLARRGTLESSDMDLRLGQRERFASGNPT